MIRTGLIKIIMWAIVPIAFTLIFFTTVDYDNGGAWISLVSVWMSYLIASTTCFSNWGKQLFVLNWTVYYCAVVYFVVELVTAILFLYVYPEYPKWSFSFQILLLVVFVLVFGFSYISNKKTEEKMQEFFENDSIVKQWRAKVALMQYKNPSNELQELLDLLSITPIISSSEVASIDEEISEMLESSIPNIYQIINKMRVVYIPRYPIGIRRLSMVMMLI
jgi:hypothetical protein